MRGPLSVEEYLRDPWLASRLGSAPRRDPDHQHAAATAYLEALPAGEQALLDEVTGGVPRARPGTRLFLFAIAGNEEASVARSLDALRRDVVSSGLAHRAEILLVVNGRAGECRDETAAVAADWAHRHPDVPAIVLDVTWPRDEPAVLARSRKLAVDAIVRRLVPDPPCEPVYLLTEDADLEWVESGRARRVVERFDAAASLDVLRGWHLRTPELLRHPAFFVERASWRIAEHALSCEPRPDDDPQAQFHWNRVVTAGWNVAFTLDAYLAAGGYTRHVSLFEDMDLGQRISVARGRARTGGFRPDTRTAEWIDVEACADGRRALLALRAGHDTYGADPSFADFVARTEAARSWTMDDAVRWVATGRREWSEVAEVLDRRHEELLAITGDEARAGRLMDHVRSALGISGGADQTAAVLAVQRRFLDEVEATRGGARSRGRALLRDAARDHLRSCA